jgi:hypothetical protein
MMWFWDYAAHGVEEFPELQLEGGFGLGVRAGTLCIPNL